MLQVNHIHLSYGPRVVLDDVSCTVAPGEKAGLIGVNGAGKSSLLKIIAGIQEPDRGNVVLPRSYGYLSQGVANETSVAEGISVRDYIFSSTRSPAWMRLSGLMRSYRCNLPVPKVTGSHRCSNALNMRRMRLIAWATTMPTRAPNS